MPFFSAAILFLVLLPGATFATELGVARISLIKGDVQIYTTDTQDWVAASINMPLREGDRLWVPNGARTEVQLQGGVYIRLGAASAFDILALQEESYQFYLNGGHVYINNRKGGIDHIQVDTPQSSVGCFDNSLVMIDVAESGATDVAVLKGYAAAETRTGKTRVEAGHELHAGGDLSAELSPLAPPDDWENWNRERDKKIVAGNRSLRYIPEELDEYAYEFDNYGKWVYVTNYGYCWTPLTVSGGWAPYRDGRWVWINGDYVWIAAEPWGWVPHHYGRWTFVVNFGWCWVPPRAGGIFWSPGYVGWVHTPTSVAWVPLAPGEIFYGRGNYGPTSVNITNTTINQTVIRNYRNIGVRNAVTVVSTTTFISGRKEPARVKENPFKAANISVGQPAIKPTRLTSMPVIRTIPAARKPPERVKRVSVEEIKRERAVVREEKGSVFTPGRPGAEMPVKKRDEPPHQKIRVQQPALPAAKPAKKDQLSPRVEQQPPIKQPSISKGRPAPIPTPAAPEKQPPTKQPEKTKDRQVPTPPPAAPEKRPPTKQPEIVRERPVPTPAKPAVQSQQPQSAAPGKAPARQQQHPAAPGKAPPATQQQQPVAPGKAPATLQQQPAAPGKAPPAMQQQQPAAPGKPLPQTRGKSPGKAQPEPRWQEPTPSGIPGAGRPRVSPQQPGTHPQPSPRKEDR